MKSSLMILFLFCTAVHGQVRKGLEQYVYSNAGGVDALAGRAYFQGRKGWYAEGRYNYEAEKSFSLYGGKTFSGEDALTWAFTPLAGIMIGDYRGCAAGMNLDLSRGNILFSSTVQYIFSMRVRQNNFLYNWSELGYQVSKHVYAGLAVQQTWPYKKVCEWDPGLQLSFSLSKWTFPIYAFNPGSGNRYVVVGITRVWE